MQTRTSFERFRRWSARHYGMIAIIGSICFFLLGLYQTMQWRSQSIILDYKMQILEQKLSKNDELERERIAYNSSVSKDLREIKGYVQGVSDKTMRQMIEQLPINYKKKEEK
jgi:hypothetical protein